MRWKNEVVHTNPGRLKTTRHDLQPVPCTRVVLGLLYFGNGRNVTLSQFLSKRQTKKHHGTITPSPTITNHHQPSSTITNHHTPSPTITNHHQPSLVKSQGSSAELLWQMLYFLCRCWILLSLRWLCTRLYCCAYTGQMAQACGEQKHVVQEHVTIWHM